MNIRTALLALAILVPIASSPVAAADPPTFDSVVKKHYAAWAKGLPSGKLTSERVNRLVNNPAIRGDEAAALAAIHLQFRTENPPAALDEAALLHHRADDPEERRDTNAKPVHFDRMFARFRSHIAKAPHDLFRDDAPRRMGMSQGNLGDCFVVAALGGFATHHPKRLKEMAKKMNDGSYVVAFPGQDPVHVPRLTDAQIALGSTAGDQGLWLNVFEEAVAIELRKKGSSSVVLDAISHGGSSARIIELLTDHAVATTTLRQRGAKEKAIAHHDAVAALENVHARKLLACVNTPHKEGLPPGIVSAHVYAVLDYQPATHMATIWNPWGNHFEPKGKPGISHGYPTKNGVFTIPVAEMEQVFAQLVCQTDQPLKKTQRH